MSSAKEQFAGGNLSDAAEESIVRPLSTLRKGTEGQVAYLRTDDKSTLRKLMAMGILPGLHIRLLQRFPSFVFQIGESRFAIDKELADRILVWRHRRP